MRLSDLILDTSGDLLERGIQACPDIVKPNKDEMEMLFQIKIESREDVIASGEKLRKQGIPWVVVSLGGEGALMFCEEGIFLGKSPAVPVVNTVGCGDSMVGALAVALHRKEEPKKALRFATAVAAANAMSAGTGNFVPGTAWELLDKVEVTEIERNG